MVALSSSLIPFVDRRGAEVRASRVRHRRNRARVESFMSVPGRLVNTAVTDSPSNERPGKSHCRWSWPEYGVRSEAFRGLAEIPSPKPSPRRQVQPRNKKRGDGNVITTNGLMLLTALKRTTSSAAWTDPVLFELFRNFRRAQTHGVSRGALSPRNSSAPVRTL